MQCLVREAAGRLHECSGQEILDLIESIATGQDNGLYIAGDVNGVWTRSENFGVPHLNFEVLFSESVEDWFNLE